MKLIRAPESFSVFEVILVIAGGLLFSVAAFFAPAIRAILLG